MSGNERLAAEVRAEAARQRISARRLAEKMQEPPSTVARKLRAETAMTLDEVEAFAEALGVSVVDLVARAYGASPISSGPSSGARLRQSAQSVAPGSPRESRYTTTPVSPRVPADIMRSSPIRTIRHAA